MNGFLIAGTSSGVGKTTVSMALIAAMRKKGKVVQAFKGGPDFLDTGHLTRISGRIARNLDTWMLSAEANVEVLTHGSRGADLVVVEGMMGLFDGKDGASEVGSTAEIAKLLKLPVLLVLDARKSARSIAAVVLGFEKFDPSLPIAGLILNGVASERHFEMLALAIRSACVTPVLGWLHRDASITIPERHLGLQTAEEAPVGDTLDDLIAKLASLAEEHLDLSRIMALECGLSFAREIKRSQGVSKDEIRIGVPRDRAFSFYYEDNFDLLREHGATIVSFSPLDDHQLPENLDALYLGGGYPEIHAEKLSANTGMLSEIRHFAASGRPVYAECGGMLYLSKQIRDSHGYAHQMAGVLPFEIAMMDKLVSFGYVTVTLNKHSLLGREGSILRGHSFHYSRILDAENMETSFRVHYSLSGRTEDEGFRLGNTLASYIHLHFRANPSVAESFVQAAAAARQFGMVAS